MKQIPEHILETFLAESEERLDDIESGILALEGMAETPDEELIHSIFRDAHSIKAGANLLHFSNLETLAHRLENLLDLMRQGQVSPGPDMVATLLEALDKMRDLLDNLEASDRMDISRQLEGLNRFSPTSV